MTNRESSTESRRADGPKKRWWKRRWFVVVVCVIVVALGAAFAAAEYALHHAAPLLRKRVIATLSAHFGSQVQLDRLDISLVKGIVVEGGGLRIPYNPQTQATIPGAAQPMITVDQFNFHTTWRGLLASVTRVGVVDVNGLTINLPAGVDRASLLSPEHKHHSNRQPLFSLLVDEIRVTNLKLILGSHDPAKEPREFDIQSVVLHDVGASQPFTYNAYLINPIPRGEIHASGHFGPWDTDTPRRTPIDGNYTFTNVDLGTIHGLSGSMTSTGQFSGPLNQITVDGTTDSPNFALDISDHPQHLTTRFHAIVNGSNGDTYLQPVDAVLGNTAFTCSGDVVDLKHVGHDIKLDVTMEHGHIGDLLAVGMKSNPPVMRDGIVAMKATLEVPPGKERVAEKIRLAGDISITGVVFSDLKFQNAIDDLSARAQGHPKEAKQFGSDKIAESSSAMKAQFALANGQMMVKSVQYSVPGAQVNLDGVYLMKGNAFKFTGHVLTKAKASQMVTGWKSLLLMPVDPFLSKHGAGVDLPIEISGEGNQVHFGLAFHGKADETPQQMKQDLKTQPVAPPDKGKKKHKKFGFSL